MKTIFRIILWTLLPLLLYEVCTAGVFSIILGVDSCKELHKAAWKQDIVYLVICISCCILVYSTWYYTHKPELSWKEREILRRSNYKSWTDDDLFI